jgi:hypothetical protein
MTADHVWEMQVCDASYMKLLPNILLKLVPPPGTTLLGTILSSDKTCITALMGNHVAHPLLLSIANIHISTQLKSSSNAFVLATLLSVSKFIHKNK